MIPAGGVDGLPFVKGHGTGNDFVLIPDGQARLDLRPGQVRAICHRRFGIGADGILRVVPTRLMPQAADLADSAEYFMDYRNADGSLAEMCGNGARVFARYLRDSALVKSDRFRIATRAGLHEVSLEPDGSVTIDMGTATMPLLRAAPIVEANGRTWPAVGVLVPNPHAVVFVDDLAEAGDLNQAPTVVPQAVFPEGVNVEFVRVLGADHVSMRVHERGVGETMACGTGACAVAWATLRRNAQGGGDHAQQQAPSGTIRVDMPGGAVLVTQADSRLSLTGPAVLVAEGTLYLPPDRSVQDSGNSTPTPL
jgi:diaminopimelate epimerase